MRLDSMTRPSGIWFTACIILWLNGPLWANVGLVEVTKGRALQVKDVLQVTARAKTRAPGTFSVVISGPTSQGVEVSATLILSEGEERRLQAPLRVRKGEQIDTESKTTAEYWYVELDVGQVIARECTIELLLDVPSKSSGTVYRVLLREFVVE